MWVGEAPDATGEATALTTVERCRRTSTHPSQCLLSQGCDTNGKSACVGHGSPLAQLDANKLLQIRDGEGTSASKRTRKAATRPAAYELVQNPHVQGLSVSERTESATLTLRSRSDKANVRVGFNYPFPTTTDGEVEVEPVQRPRIRHGLPSYDGSQGQLQAQLWDAVVQSSPDGHKTFLPLSQLRNIVNQQAVQSELRKCKNYMRKHSQKWKPIQAKTVCGDDECKSYRKVFSILVLMERPYEIMSFIEEEVCDADLPLAKMCRPMGSPSSFDFCRRNISPFQKLQCFENWGDGAIADFEQHQWTMLAPFFNQLKSKHNCHHIFEPDVILPFTSWKKGAKRSGHGQVYKVEIHPDHHALHTFEEPTNIFAIKELYSKEKEFSRQKEDFKREVETLKRLSRPEHAHDHLITLLATYEQAERYFLVFPWASADLLGYWKDINPTPSRDKATSLWLAKQCQGIADALSRIHRYETLSGTSLLHPSSFSRRDSIDINTITCRNPRQLFGRHGDIKPDNILWFPDRDGGHGILKLTDFGTAHFSTRDSVSTEEREDIPNSATYRPPEWDLPNPMLRSSYDIWTLGCVYLEFIAWFMGGCEFLKMFGEKRQTADYRWLDFPEIQTDTFFTIGKDKSGGLKAKVKESVTWFMEDIRTHSACTAFFHDFIKIIQQDLLIVECNRGRKSSANLARALDTLREKCENIPGYIAE